MAIVQISSIVFLNAEGIQNLLLYIIFPVIGTLLLIVACYATFSARFSSIKNHPQIINFGTIQMQVSLIALIFLIGLFFFSIWVYFLNQGYDKKIKDFDKLIYDNHLEIERYRSDYEKLRDNKIQLTFTMELDSSGLNKNLPRLSDLKAFVYLVNDERPIEISDISPAPAGNAVRIAVELKRQQLIQSILLVDKNTGKQWVSASIWNPFEPNIKLAFKR